MIDKWDLRFLRLAREVSTWSKDPSTKAGAVITDFDHRVLGLGYNGFPRYVEDSEARLNDRSVKYGMMVHAEANAILFAGPLHGSCVIYTWPTLPCSRCTALIIQTPIIQVVSVVDPDAERAVRLGHALTKEMFDEVYLHIDLYEKEEIERAGEGDQNQGREVQGEHPGRDQSQGDDQGEGGVPAAAPERGGPRVDPVQGQAGEEEVREAVRAVWADKQCQHCGRDNCGCGYY